MRKNWIFIKKLNLTNYIIMLKRSLLLINLNNNSDVKLSKIIKLLNKNIDI